MMSRTDTEHGAMNVLMKKVIPVWNRIKGLRRPKERGRGGNTDPPRQADDDEDNEEEEPEGAPFVDPMLATAMGVEKSKTKKGKTAPESRDKKEKPKDIGKPKPKRKAREDPSDPEDDESGEDDGNDERRDRRDNLPRGSGKVRHRPHPRHLLRRRRRRRKSSKGCEDIDLSTKMPQATQILDWMDKTRLKIIAANKQRPKHPAHTA
eukprot:1228229-Amphidinium_carterae.3